MESKENLSALQIIVVVITCRLLINLSFTPAINLPPANQDAWIVDLLSGFYILIFYVPFIILSNKFRQTNLVDYLKKITGVYVGKLLGFLYSMYLLFFIIFFTVIFVDFINTIVLVETPMYVIMLPLLGIGAYSAFKGVGSICRSAVLFIPLILLTLVAFVILNINNMDFSTLFPVLKASSFTDINISAISMAGRFSDGVMLAVLLQYLGTKYSVNKLFIWTVIVFTATATLITITTNLVLGIDYAKRVDYPFFVANQQINVFNFIQRIEFVNVIGLILGFLVKISIFFFASSILLEKIFVKINYKYFVILEIVISYLIIFSTRISDTVVYRELIYTSAPYLISFFTYIIPLIILIVYYYRKKLTVKIE